METEKKEKEAHLQGLDCGFADCARCIVLNYNQGAQKLYELDAKTTALEKKLQKKEKFGGSWENFDLFLVYVIGFATGVWAGSR